MGVKENEALEQLKKALGELRLASDKCEEAEFGDMVMGGVEESINQLSYALSVVQGAV